MYKSKIQLGHWETGYEILYCPGKCVVCGYKLRLEMKMHLRRKLILCKHSKVKSLK